MKRNYSNSNNNNNDNDFEKQKEQMKDMFGWAFNRSDSENKPPNNTFIEDEEKLKENFHRIVFEAYHMKRKAFESALTPQEIVNNLDKHLVSQKDAKRAISIALRNRFRRKQLLDWYTEDEKKNVGSKRVTIDPKEIIPKNMLLIGPTG